MAAIDGTFCLDARVYKRKMLSVVTLEQSEIIGTYNTPDTVGSNRKTKYITKLRKRVKYAPVVYVDVAVAGFCGAKKVG